ncbi:universal stress protein [Variovorax sp. J22R133]|uniref:universal stress protein n=1 Tax=Variovorax brevis TaxID=3053503 RepID=UPI002575BA7C|nr:universal stress protein [Variovorax sp. J22R133]MDM0117980.1 universal stress protein [Variovorax sp. J22R133]
MSNDIKTILYAGDVSDDCERVLAYAIDMANRLGARLQVLTVIPDQREKSLIEVDSHVPQQMLDQYHDARALRVRQHIEAQVAAFYAVRADKTPQRPIAEITVHEGDDVAELILEEARMGSADLILMASRGEGLLMGLLFGSVVNEVTRKSHVPLLLVPIREEREPGAQP